MSYLCRNDKCKEPLSVPRPDQNRVIPVQESKGMPETVMIKCPKCGTLNAITVSR
ncbi:MAG: hypothetical protein U0797_30350 [Gemmataceae bacterium]